VVVDHIENQSGALRVSRIDVSAQSIRPSSFLGAHRIRRMKRSDQVAIAARESPRSRAGGFCRIRVCKLNATVSGLSHSHSSFVGSRSQNSKQTLNVKGLPRI
jgi:hypothetical protein